MNKYTIFKNWIKFFKIRINLIEFSKSVYQSVNHSLNIKFLQMRVFLTNSYKNNRLSCSVNHIQCCPNFVVYRIEFSHYNTINYSRILLLNCKVNQWLIELCKLVNWVVSNQSFTYKQDNIRLVDVDKFCESFHQRLISLHSSGSVY